MKSSVNTRSRATSSDETTTTITLQSLDRKLDKILDQMSIINKRLDKLEATNDEQERSIEFLHTELETTKQELDRMSHNLSESHHTSPQSLENLIRRVEANEHANRARSIELNGIPFAKEENLVEGVEKLAKHLKFTWLNITTDIDTVYRIKQSKRVIVKFTQTGKRDQFFQLYRKNIANTKALGFKDDQKIYINEVLSKDQANLFWMVRTFKKNYNYKYVWTANQRIYIRKSTDSDAIQIKSKADLDTLEASALTGT